MARAKVEMEESPLDRLTGRVNAPIMPLWGLIFFFFTNFANKRSIFIARIIIFVIFVKV